MKITLAGKDYNFDELFYLGQIRKISVILAEDLEPVESAVIKTDAIWDRRLRIIEIALKPVWPGISVEALEATKIQNAELKEAVEKILDHAGLLPKKDTQPSGEVVAEAA